LEQLHSSYRNRLALSSDYQRRFSVIQTVLEQGKNLFAGKKVSNRIVSIDRHYLRPIIRGKETKSVEFGAKVIQIDGISFIEHISFKAFNEGVRLKDCIHLQQQLTGVRVKALAADSIYANNANRKFCTLHIQRPRNKYLDVRRAYLAYSKLRKRRKSQTRMITRRLLQLLEKLLDQLEQLHSFYRSRLALSSDYQRRFSVIQTVLEQGKNLFAGKKVSNRIVSIDRHYLRPIIRGKETKSVEFGAKVNNIQIDGISLIEHISFKAFNEGVRLKDCIHLQQQLTGVRVKALAADSIYANNANRKFCTKYHISTSFKRKGRAAKDEPLRRILRSELSRERATRLEGSFGTQKQHYSLARIKARNRKTEVLWIFFGIHTANAVC
uniref:transposase n=1 Tax=Bacteroides finegoldii TaxID=338188 RepID=UPI001F016F7A